MQRYTLVRRLVGRRLHARAAAQAEVLFAAICARWGVAPGAQAALSPVDKGEPPESPAARALPGLPRPRGSEAKEDVAVVVGTVLNLAVCAVEGHPGGSTPAQLRLLPAVGALDPWLRRVV